MQSTYGYIYLSEPVSDATILLRDVAGDAAQNAATRINPSEDRLGQIDNPAEDNTWHDVPDLSPAALKAQARDQYNKQKPFSKADLQNAQGDATAAAHPSGSRDPADAAALAAQDQQEGTNSGVDPRAGATNAISNLKGTASENVPEETKEKARNFQNRTKNYVGSKIPKERRDQTIYRLKKMVVEIQSHSDCECTCPMISNFQLINNQIRRPSRPCYLLPSSTVDTVRTWPSKALGP